MKPISEALKAYVDTHPFDAGTCDCETVLEQLYQAYTGNGYDTGRCVPALCPHFLYYAQFARFR